MYLIPTKEQWRRWSLPSKLTAIGAYLAIVMFILYFVDKCQPMKIFNENQSPTQKIESKKKKNLIEPFENGVISVPIDTSIIEIPVNVELIHMPKKSENLWYLYYDVYLRNNSTEDILFTSINYTSSYDIPRGDGGDSGVVFPNVMYEFEYEIELWGKDYKSQLNPPYELKSKDIRAIRFHFRPKKDKYFDDLYLPHYFSFKLVDSKGRNLSVFSSYLDKI